MLHPNQVSVREDKALLCLHITPLWPARGGPPTPRIWGNSLVQKQHGGSSSWVAQSPRTLVGPCSPLTKQESSQVTLKGLSNVTGTFDLKSSFNIFHHMAKGSLASSVTSRKEAGLQGYFVQGAPCQGTFLTRTGAGRAGSETMP